MPKKCSQPHDINKTSKVNMGNAKDYSHEIGQKYYDWEVTDWEKDHKGQIQLTCKCQCGQIKTIEKYVLKKGLRKRCIICAAKERSGLNSPNRKGYKEISGLFWNQIVTAASKRSIKLSISCKEVYDLLADQNFRCALSGNKLYLSQTYKEHTKEKKTTASLDRIDSSKGYVLSNLQWVHKDINKMKWAFNEEIFLNWCKTITNYQDCK